MPSATDELRQQMLDWFGCPISDTGPIQLLKSHGYTLTRRWSWKLPTPSHTVSEIERTCIVFLIQEWDFDGIEGAVNEGEPS